MTHSRTARGTFGCHEAKSHPDWTIGVKMGRGADRRFYIADVVRVHETPGKVRQRLINTASQDGAAVGIRIPKDAGQAGIAQAEDYVTALAGYIVSAVAPTGSKEVCAKPLSSQVEIGSVLLLRGPWNEAFLEELGMFPAGSHDDQVDAAADAFNELAGVPARRGADRILPAADRGQLNFREPSPRVVDAERRGRGLDNRAGGTGRHRVGVWIVWGTLYA